MNKTRFLPPFTPVTMSTGSQFCRVHRPLLGRKDARIIYSLIELKKKAHTHMYVATLIVRLGVCKNLKMLPLNLPGRMNELRVPLRDSLLLAPPTSRLSPTYSWLRLGLRLRARPPARLNPPHPISRHFELLNSCPCVGKVEVKTRHQLEKAQHPRRSLYVRDDCSLVRVRPTPCQRS